MIDPPATEPKGRVGAGAPVSAGPRHRTTAPDVVKIRAQISDLLSEYRIPSAAVGILHEGEITEFAVGVTNVLTGQTATTDTIYQCGSMTKTWTALAFMQLVDEGRIGLDDPVRTYLPDFRVADPEVTRTVTPRQLLNHTNGIEEAFGDCGEDDDVYERMVNNIADAPQVHPPGATHGYSAALGYAVLARIMEVADGKRWDDIMRDRLFEALELRGTSTWHEQVDQNRAATGHLAISLEGDPMVSPVAYLPRCYGPGGNINSTVRDVLTMAHVFLDNGVAYNGARIVTAESIGEMMKSRVPVPDPYLLGSEWALGLTVYDWAGHAVYAHDGSTVGQHARLRILPGANLAIVMLANGGPRDSFYRKMFNAILTDRGAVTIPDLPKADPSLQLDPSHYEGAYARPGVCYEVSAKSGKLYLRFDRDPMQARILRKPERARYELVPIDATHFMMPSDDPLEDTQTVAIYAFENQGARYLHTNARVHPRVAGR